MIIKSITIRNFGAIDLFTRDFTDGLNVVKSSCTDELSYAIRFVLNHKLTPLPAFMVRGDTKIEALVYASKKTYRLVATQDSKQKNLCLHVYDECSVDVTNEYLYLTSHCFEHDISDVFKGDAEKTLFRLLQYLDEDHYYGLRELARRTDRLSETKAFRAYLRSFIKNFESEPIREGKHYELVLGTNGRYGVRYKNNDDLPVFLSESEQTLFRYICFLKTAEFWHGFDELRNLHCIKKPLLIENFLERLDGSIDIQDLLQRTMQLKRQLILLTM